MIFSKTHRSAAEVNASSMADIAFLLLIFFLVSTVINTEKGIFVKLPPIDNETPLSPVSERNIFVIKINANDQLLVEGEITPMSELRSLTKTFLLNPDDNPTLAAAPDQAIISLQNDRSTSYKTYLAVYNELKAAYRELWENAAKTAYGKSYEKLSNESQTTIRNRYPMVISESEQVDFVSK